MEATAKHITVAAIDLGSNTFRLLIARIRDGELFPLAKELASVQLGKGLRSSGLLSTEAMDRALAVLEQFRQEMARHRIDRCRCCGTEALRKATNAPSFLLRAAAIIGQEIDILAGDKEALLSCDGALGALYGEPPFPLVVVDVGGGSTEITFLASHASTPLTTSIPAGAVGFTELVGECRRTQAKDHLADELTAFAYKTGIRPGQTSIIATGGTATSLASLDLHLVQYDEKKVHGHRLSRKNLGRLAEGLESMSSEELYSLPGMEPGR